VQDVYKFTAQGDDRRIVAGTIESGTIRVGDEVAFAPSGKCSHIKSIETFPSAGKASATAGEASGFTLTEEIYIKPGELLYKINETKPLIRDRLVANIFWMGRAPLIKEKSYLLKLGTARIEARLEAIESVFDASALAALDKDRVERHDAARVRFVLKQPLAFDRAADFESTGRFVVVDKYEIAGGGIVLDALEGKGENSNECFLEQNCTPGIVLLTEQSSEKSQKVAKVLERQLKEKGFRMLHLDMISFPDIQDDELTAAKMVEQLRKEVFPTDFYSQHAGGI